jgi:hypothetical protein
MKPEWYGDNRDLVKWTVILQTAVNNLIDEIIWVAYYRDAKYPRIKIDGHYYELPKEIEHLFRNPNTVTKIDSFHGNKVNIRALFDEWNKKNRNTYHSKIVSTVEKLSQRYILFLDPDTGIQPKVPSEKHVSHDEILMLWEKLSIGSILIIYQHKPQRTKGNNWIVDKKAKLADILGLDNKQIGVGESEIAKDVVLYIIKKEHGQ